MGPPPLPLGAILVVVLAIAAGYIPTVLIDHEVDRQAGLQTTAVALGLRASWILGLEALLAANATMTVLALQGAYVAPAFVLLQASFIVVEVLAYVALVPRSDPQSIFLGGSIVTAAFFGNLAAFLLVYVL